MKRFLLVLSLIGLLAGCRKDDLVDCTPTPTSPPPGPPNPPPSPPTSNLSLADFCRRNRTNVQYFKVAPNRPWTITTGGGATLTFPGSAISYLLPTGLPTTDTLLVRLREIYKVPEMVLSDMPTVAQNQQLLISGGEFSIQLVRARSTDRVRAVALGTSLISLRSPLPNPQDTLFVQQLWQQPYTPSGLLGWQTSGIAPYPAVQRQAGFYRSLLPLDSLSWWNIDRVWQAYTGAALTATVVEVPTASAIGETRVYLRPAGANGLARLSATGSTYTQWQGNMPLGASMQAIVLQSINGQLYFGTQLFTVQSGVVIKPTLTAVSEPVAVQLIRQL